MSSGGPQGAESHAGQIFTCVGALAIAGAAHHVDHDLLGWWLAERQTKAGGLNGRPEKLADVTANQHCTAANQRHSTASQRHFTTNAILLPTPFYYQRHSTTNAILPPPTNTILLPTSAISPPTPHRRNSGDRCVRCVPAVPFRFRSPAGLLLVVGDLRTVRPSAGPLDRHGRPAGE